MTANDIEFIRYRIEEKGGLWKEEFWSLFHDTF